MLKKILCIALVIVIVGAAVGFVVYENVGMTYDYEGKDMSKYLGMTLTPEQIKELAIDLSDVEDWRELAVSDDEVGYKIAAAISEIADANKDALEGGTLSDYDQLTFVYYITDTEGNVISDPKMMDITAADKNKPAFQIGQNPEDATSPKYPELSGMLSDALVGKDYSIFNVFTTGKVEANDTIWVEYTVTIGDDANTAKTYLFQKTTIAGLDSLKAGDMTLAGLTAQFNEKQDSIIAEGDVSTVPSVIGNAEAFKGLTLTIDEQTITVDMKVLFASRAIVTKGDIADGDTVYFTYKNKNDSEAEDTQLVTTKDAAGEAEMLRVFESADFYTELMKLKIEEASNKEIEVTVGEDTITYVVTIDYATPADATVVRDGLIKADPFVAGDDGKGIPAKYPSATKENKYDATGEVVEDGSLADTDVLVYMYVVSGTTVDLTAFETFYEDLEFTSTGDEDADAYFKAYDEYMTADEALKKENEKSEPNEETVADLTTKLEAAKTAFEEAQKKYGENVDDGVTERDVAADIKAEFEKDKRDAAQIDFNNEIAYGIAYATWEKLLEEVKANDAITYPSKALRLAKEGILDELKQTYYSNRDKEGYVEYKNFNSYLTQKVYADQDKDAAIQAEAEQDVLENMLVYYLADIYDANLDTNDIAGVEAWKNVYAAYNMEMPAGYWEAMETGILFDKVMRLIAEDRNPDISIDDLK